MSARASSAWLLFGVSFLSFLHALTGTVPTYRDSGDLISSAATLGIAHPPGYPAYVLITKLFLTVMPFGNVAYRVNVSSALLAAGCVALLFIVLLREWGNKEEKSLPLLISAAAPAILLARTPAMWDLARVAEMYAFAALFGVLILFLATSPEKLLAAVFCLSVGVTVHPTLIVLLPVLMMSYLGQEPAQRPSWLAILGVALLGGSVLLFLPWRSAQYPWADWGHPVSPRNLWRLLTRADYGGLKLHPEQSHLSWTPESLQAQVCFFCKSFINEWGWPAVLIGCEGWVRGLRSVRSKQWLGLLIAFVLAGPAFYTLSNLPLDEATTPAILQPYLLLPGILWTLALTGAIAAGWKRSKVVGIVVSLLILFPLRRSLESSRNDFHAYDYGRDLMRSLPPKAALYDPDDSTTFSLMTLQATEGRRTDLAFLSFFRTRWGYEQMMRRYPEMLPGPMANAAELEKALWSHGIAQRPIFAELPQKLAPIPYRSQALVYAADPRFTGKADPASQARGEQLFALYGARGLRITKGENFFTQHVIDFYAAAHSNLGLSYAQDGQIDSAVHHYKEGLRINPGLAAAWNNWGVVEFNRKNFSQAATLFKRALDHEPSNAGFRRNLETARQELGS